MRSMHSRDDQEKQAAWVLLGEQKRVEQLMAGREGKEELNMCQAIEELIQDGRCEGKLEGRKMGITQVNTLIQALIQAERLEDVAKCTMDLAYQEQLFKEFGLA